MSLITHLTDNLCSPFWPTDCGLEVKNQANVVLKSPSFPWTPDQPNIDIPEEIVSDENLELTCYAPDNCPDLTPEIQWMYTDYLPDPEFSSDYLEEGNTAVLSSTLTFTPRPMHNGQLLGCRVYYPNTTLVYERLISLDIKCKFKINGNFRCNYFEYNKYELYILLAHQQPQRPWC